MMDESTFGSFYEVTRKPLWSYIARMMKDNAVADDIFQETYIKFLQSGTLPETEPQRKSYLYRIATNLMHDHWRKLKRELKRSEDEMTQKQTTNEGHESDLRHDVEKTFQHLTHQQRILLWLAYVEEYGHKEIAEILKLREKSIKVLLFRAKRKFIDVCRLMGITSEDLV